MRDIRGLNISVERDSLTGEDAIVVSGNMRAFRDLARKYDIQDFLLLIGNPLFS